VITLRFFENKQVKEVGEILGKQEGSNKLDKTWVDEINKILSGAS